MKCRELLVLHIDKRAENELRSRLFGHPGIIVPFKEGMIAKQQVIEEELAFYRNYNRWIHKIMASDLIPHVEGISTDRIDINKNHEEITLSIQKTLPPRGSADGSQILILRDIAGGYKHPCVLDIKLGQRTWGLGDAVDKVLRHKIKCLNATTASLRFKVRAAIWHSPHPNKWQMEGGVNYVTREFGNKCSRNELVEFLSDFLHHDGIIDYFITKLSDIRRALMRLRIEADVRMFSSSVLLVYDEEDPSKHECRLLDFAKTYFNIQQKAALYNENIEDCEDGVIPALTNLIELLQKM